MFVGILIGILIGIILAYLVFFFIPSMLYWFKFLRWNIFKPNNFFDTMWESFLEFIGVNRF